MTPRPLATIAAELKAARAHLRALVAEERASREHYRPKTAAERTELFRQRALASVRALPPMSEEQLRDYKNFRWKKGATRAQALEAVGVAA